VVLPRSLAGVDDLAMSSAAPIAPAASGRHRFGLARTPVVTVVVFTLTAGVNIAQLTAAPGLLSDLERTSAGLRGEWWRTFTSLLVQDGGAAGTVSNLLFLLAIGALAEQAVSRARWLLCYVGIGVVGQLIGYAWQPTGAGNSVAVCGLSGALAVAIVVEGDRLPRAAVPVQLAWCGALLATWYYPLVVLGMVAAGASLRVPRPRLQVAWGALAATAATALALTAVRNIHGVALLAALMLAATMQR
jgi:membrane associated rhomboid family serine protease